MANFTEGDYGLVPRDNFSAGEKLALRWRGPLRISKAITHYVYQVEDLREGTLEEAHDSRLLFYSDPLLDTEAIILHVISSETGMHVQRLIALPRDLKGSLSSSAGVDFPHPRILWN